MPPVRQQPHLLTPSAQTVIHGKQKIQRPNSQQIMLYYLGLCTQNQGLREENLEASPNRGSGKINRLRPRQNNTTEKAVLYTAWFQK